MHSCATAGGRSLRRAVRWSVASMSKRSFVSPRHGRWSRVRSQKKMATLERALPRIELLALELVEDSPACSSGHLMMSGRKIVDELGLGRSVMAPKSRHQRCQGEFLGGAILRHAESASEEAVNP